MEIIKRTTVLFLISIAFALLVAFSTLAPFEVAAQAQCPCPGDTSGAQFRAGTCRIDCPNGGTDYTNYATGGGTLQTIITAIGNAIFALVPVAASLALLAFFWGLAMYLFSFGEGKDEKLKQGRNLMLYGVLVIFVMVSIFGIVLLLRSAFGVVGETRLPPPSVDFGTP
jgi:hypothetical protein